MGTRSFREAIRRFEIAQKSPEGENLRLNSPMAESYTGLASELLELGKPTDAQHMALHAIKLTPTLSKAYKVLGFSYRHLGLHEEGLLSFQRVTQLSPQDPEGWANLALVQSHTGRSPEAISSFREVCRQMNLRFIWNSLALSAIQYYLLELFANIQLYPSITLITCYIDAGHKTSSNLRRCICCPG